MKILKRTLGWLLLILGLVYPGVLCLSTIFWLFFGLYGGLNPTAGQHLANMVIPGFLIASLVISGVGFWLRKNKN